MGKRRLANSDLGPPSVKDLGAQHAHTTTTGLWTLKGHEAWLKAEGGPRNHPHLAQDSGFATHYASITTCAQIGHNRVLHKRRRVTTSHYFHAQIRGPLKSRTSNPLQSAKRSPTRSSGYTNRGTNTLSLPDVSASTMEEKIRIDTWHPLIPNSLGPRDDSMWADYARSTLPWALPSIMPRERSSSPEMELRVRATATLREYNAGVDTQERMN